MAPGGQQNIAKGLDGASRGADRDRRETALSGCPGHPAMNGRLAPPQQNVCGPLREIEPLTRSSRGSLPRKGPHAWSDRFPGWSLQPRAAGLPRPPVSVRKERSALTLGRPLHPHHEEPGRAHAVQRRDPQQAAKFRVSTRRDGASARHREMPQGLIKLSTHRRIPSVMGRNICGTASRVMGKIEVSLP